MSYDQVRKLAKEIAQFRQTRRWRRARPRLGQLFSSARQSLAAKASRDWQGGYVPVEEVGWLYLPDVLDAQALRILIDGTRPDPAISLLCRSGDIAFDVGANLGEWAVPLARAVGAKGAVYAFEPVPVLADALRKSFRVNGCSQAFVIEAGIADQTGKGWMEMVMAAGADGALSRLTDDFSGEEVDIVSIDDVVRDRKIERLDFLKIDVEGAEPRVLAGAAETIDRFRPKIVFESGHEGTEGRQVIAGALRDADYDLIGILLDGVIAGCTWDAYEDPTGPFVDGQTRNLLALPANSD